MTTSQKDLYNKFIQGDKITNNELKEGVPFWRELSSRLNKAGPIFKLCANEAGRVYRELNNYANARGVDLEQPTSVFEITWKNTLCWEHLPSNLKYSTIDKFCEVAKELGYPHFAWSGRIYFTKTGAFTGVFSDEI